MSIPLDRLYNFLKDVSNRDDIIIYRYWPHGSKNMQDLSAMAEITKYSAYQRIVYIPVVCHDQEPLICHAVGSFHRHPSTRINNIEYACNANIPTSFYKLITGINCIYDEVLLVHSEKNSDHLDELERSGCRGVYWWSHAIISQDWYRYAEHDPALKFNLANLTKDFLIYNRAWSGTREYRLKFAELVVKSNLLECCQMAFNAVDNDIHFSNHSYKNTAFSVTENLESCFVANQSLPSASADYDSADYNRCAIEVVLETLFDDSRLHLTEKTLRPIACGKPFILASTPGSLEYLRSYGFKTFAPWIDESYDHIQNPVERLEAIIEQMRVISSLPTNKKTELWTNLHLIAEFNKNRFFSKLFFDQVVGEFQTNFGKAVAQTQQHRSGWFYQQWKQSILSNKTTMTVTNQELTDVEQRLLD